MEGDTVIIQVPFVAGNVLVRVGGACAVERQRHAFVHRIRPIGIGHRRPVEHEVGQRVELVLSQECRCLATEGVSGN